MTLGDGPAIAWPASAPPKPMGAGGATGVGRTTGGGTIVGTLSGGGSTTVGGGGVSARGGGVGGDAELAARSSAGLAGGAGASAAIGARVSARGLLEPGALAGATAPAGPGVPRPAA